MVKMHPGGLRLCAGAWLCVSAWPGSQRSQFFMKFVVNKLLSCTLQCSQWIKTITQLAAVTWKNGPQSSSGGITTTLGMFSLSFLHKVEQYKQNII